MPTVISDPSSMRVRLRSPELHDFSDFPRFPARLVRPVAVILTLAALAIVGHFTLTGRGTPEVVQHASPMTRA